MDARPTTADSKQHYYPPHLQLWNRSISSPVVPRLNTTTSLNTDPVSVSVSATTTPTSATHSPSHFPATHIDLLPILYPQQSSLYHAQLLQYNKLIAPGRGRGGRLQTPPLPPLLSTPNIHVGPRSRSSSKVSNKDPTRAKPGTQNCHGNRGPQNNTTKGDRAVITGTGKESKMAPPKKSQAQGQAQTQTDLAHPLPARPIVASTSPAKVASVSQQTNSHSVPSTPHQHPRKFSFESSEPSPNANPAHSPRSAYSETNGNVPSLRPLPPRNGGCKYETSLKISRRRMPYSIGSDRLEKSDLNKIRSKLSEDDERRLTTDMREVYDRLKPTSTVEERRQKLVQKLEKLLNSTWPGHDIRVHLFGSSGNMLCSDDSDVDICITTPWRELESVCKLADLLAQHGMEQVVCVSSAKVPIVKFWDPELGLACDMNVNNTLALENTRMIRTYVDIDDRVRPLAMIIKHWTRRRIINDAAFGGTLSSYTWICMIIAFLQLRQPPVVPAVHQRPHQKLGKREGEIAVFADDLDKLRGFGGKNKSTLGELLFQFFRFYAHEFDYSESALSVRLGRLMPKTDRKNWVLAINGQLCVEEPFNTMRNLGNTADDFSFRGIHLELRRAFDLVSEGKLEEACEQYVFPKEEEKPLFQKPSTVPRPVLLRSASQQNNRGGRGGNNRGGNRQQGQYRNNNHGNNRRASSSTAYDNNANQVYYQGYPYVGPDGNMYMQPEVLAQTLSALQLQENNLRFLQYTQNQALAQQQALAHAQRMQGNLSQSQSSTERSRTNSFDNPPLTAPLRPEFYFFPQIPGQPFFQQPSFTSYPSSPSSNQATAEQRRASHRSTAASEAGMAAPAPGSALRSQSQPASRTVPVVQPVPTFLGQAPVLNGVTSIPARHINGVPMPSFMPDESNDTDQETSSTHTPPEDEKYYGHHLDSSLVSPGRRPNGVTNGVMPAFGDIGPQNSTQGSQSRRRQSSDQFPQSVLDRIKRPSRSPSPLGHNRASSVGTGRAANSAPLLSAPFPVVNSRPVQDTKPLVVNGSGLKPSSVSSSRAPSTSEAFRYSDALYDNPLHISHRSNGTLNQFEPPATQSALPIKTEPIISERPCVVNGSSNAPIVSSPSVSRYSNETAMMMSNGSVDAPSFSPVIPQPAASNSPAGFQRFLPRQPQSPLIAQLDLATGDRMQSNGAQHLSPVYEHRTPSPSVTRRFDLPLTSSRSRPSASGTSRDPRQELKTKQKSPVDPPSAKLAAAHAANPRVNGLTRENGHTRGAKSESDNTAIGGWQKIGKGKKKGSDTKSKSSEVYPQSEQLPKNESERKGG
ncbi:hypothetical protein BJ170DRAFT_161606 [Xylariales sp. AK1849]|nr:hypothetical protein BJ170DRAFT_161606 [Xylariales sp. AK1849]